MVIAVSLGMILSKKNGGFTSRVQKEKSYPFDMSPITSNVVYDEVNVPRKCYG